MARENLNYLAQIQKILFENKENLIELSRKCLIPTYSASLKLLDSEETLQFLQINLEKYEKVLNTFKNDTKPGSSVTNNRTLCSIERDINSLLNQLCHLTDGLECVHRDLNEESFYSIMKSFISNSDIKEIKIRNFAKRLTPQYVKKEVKATSSTPPVEEVKEANKNEINTRNCVKTCPHQCINKKVKVMLSTASEEEIKESKCSFRIACEELDSQIVKQDNCAPVVGLKRNLGYRRGVQSKFILPTLTGSESNEELTYNSNEWVSDKRVDQRLKNIDPKMVELIRSEIMDNAAIVQWNEIAGLEAVKSAIQEAVVWPLLRPDIFTGLRKPAKGILLFGPPGTGKTLIGKCVASQSKSTFFNISASSLTSKWIGDGEKMVRALFAVALCHQPAVIFIDEIDSLLSQRNEIEHESTRRLKTEFLVRLDGATTSNDECVLVIGATNRPQEIDDAARRRFVKRLYIPLPDYEARLQIVTNLMAKEHHCLTETEILNIVELSDGYSGADLKNLCSEASLGPIRSIDIRRMETIGANEVRAVNMQDFIKALALVRSSVSPNDLSQYVEWNKIYGSGCSI